MPSSHQSGGARSTTEDSKTFQITFNSDLAQKAIVTIEAMNIIKILLILLVIYNSVKEDGEFKCEKKPNLHPCISGQIFRLTNRNCVGCNKKIRINSNKNNCILILLIISGDVELNPGPATKKVSNKLTPILCMFTKKLHLFK